MLTSVPTSGVLAGASGASDRFSASRRLIARMSTGSAPTPRDAVTVKRYGWRPQPGELFLLKVTADAIVVVMIDELFLLGPKSLHC